MNEGTACFYSFFVWEKQRVKQLTSDAKLGFGVGAAGDAETLANILSSIASLHWLNGQRSIFRHRHPAVVLVRKHQRLQQNKNGAFLFLFLCVLLVLYTE